MKALHREKALTAPPILSFYCRMKNLVVARCSMARGPGTCPLRNECPAYCHGEAPSRSPAS